MINKNNYKKRSQDLKSVFHDSGQFYWGQKNMVNKKIFDEKSSIFLLPRLRVQDIDNIDDWKIAERLYKLNNEKKIKFKNFSTIGKEEFNAVKDVLKSGILSGFVAGYPNGFNGGKYNQLFENKVKSFYKCKHAIALNSWTSGLIASVGALDVNPGDEIIVSPWTMSATATAILHWNAIPVFADIEPNTFSIDPIKVKKLITKKTKAIITVDIFGHPSKLLELKKIVKNKNIKIITDSAQSPYSFYGNRLAGTQSDIGGFSFNCHKHIQTGEGGVVVTNNKKLAERIKLIRNHAEAIIEKKIKKINNLVGYNFRLGEMEAAIGIQQLRKLKIIVKKIAAG